MKESRDLLILGGGLVGMTLALAAASKGISSHVVDMADPAHLTADGFDGRVTAVSTASWNLFTNIGLGEELAPRGCPIEAIAVSDGMKPGRIDFKPEPGDGVLGIMFPNRDLRLALFNAARRQPLITWHAPVRVAARHRDAHGVAAELENGTRLSARLMIAAEGRRSPTREEAGISLTHWDYRHRAIIIGLTHEKPHDNVAWEIFYPSGPFALLPMLDGPHGEHRSALVWSVAEKDAAGMLALPDRALLAEISRHMHGIYGEIGLNGPRSSYPLSYQRTARITAERLALVGDAAHGIHPIAGQGLNLGLRDVGALVEVLADGMRLGLDPGDAQLLRRYEKWRGLDSFTVALSTDVLTRLFGVPGRVPSAIRRLGMAGVQRFSPLKRWFMDEARGVSGNLPQLLKA